MGIFFEEFSGNVGDGSLRLAPLRVRALPTSDVGFLELRPLTIAATAANVRDAAGALHTLPLQLRAAANDGVAFLQMPALVVTAAASTDLVPSIGIGSLSVGDLTVNARAFATRDGEATLQTLMYAFGTDASAIGHLNIPMYVRALDVLPPILKQAILVPVPGLLSIGVSTDPTLPPKIINEVIAFQDTEAFQAILFLSEQIAFSSQFTRLLDSLKVLTDRLGFSDTAEGRVRQVIAEILGLLDSVVGGTAVAIKLIERLGIAADPIAVQQAIALVAVVMAFLDAADPLERQIILDSLLIEDPVSFGEQEGMTASSIFGLTGAAINTLTVTAVGRDVFSLSDQPMSILSILKQLKEGIGFSIGITLGDETHTTWVMNTEGQAFRQYDNYPFNSYAKIGDRYFGASADGIYELVGDTDDGEPIAAHLRTGLMNFGTMQMKRFEMAYMGLATDGTMRLKVITTSPQGDKIAYYYRMNERPTPVAQENRIKIGRGLESVYWSFELSNEDGADFEVSDMELLPMVLNNRFRRK